MIFSMVSDADSIIYVPKDRRRKVDVRHREAHYFHNLLLVSKTFITPDEFAFAILSSAKLTFHSYNEIRRLTAEVPPSFKEIIRHIHLSRTHAQDDLYIDTFNGFSAIDKTLSTHMPKLRRVDISWPGHCAQVALCSMSDSPDAGAEDPMCSSMVEAILSEKSQGEISAGRVLHRNCFSHIAASFIGDRSTKRYSHNWTRPLGWIRRLMSYAEDRNIEVVLHMEVCVAYINRPSPGMLMRRNSDMVQSTCWSLSGPRLHMAYWQTHLEAKMSSRDYMLRVEYNGQTFAYHQKLAYDLLHSPGQRGMNYWLDMTRGVDPRTPYNLTTFMSGDGF